MAIEYLFFGFLVKIVTGLDDTITRIPILASVTNKRLGKIIFSIGTLTAIAIAIITAVFFASFIGGFAYARYISAGLVFILALLIYFDVFVHKPRAKAEEKILTEDINRYAKIFGVGFISSFATAVDDVIAYLPLFVGGWGEKTYAVMGIIMATVLQILGVIFFSVKISRIKYKEEIASAGLVVLGVLILLSVV